MIGAILRPVAVGIAYYVAATISLYLTRGGNGIATIWPSSGILLASLLLAPRPAIPAYTAAAAVGSIMANLGSGGSWTAAAGFTVANMIESNLAAWLLHRRGMTKLSFVDPTDLASFCAAAVIAAAISASTASLATPRPTLDFLASWFTTDVLGMLVVGPMALIAAEMCGRNRQDGPQSLIEPIALLSMVGLTTALTFSQSTFPLLFLPMIALLVAVLRLGTTGAVAGIFIIGIGSSVASCLDTGPIHLIRGSRQTEVLFLQFYLLALLASALPVASLLAGRERLSRSLAERNKLLRMAEGVAEVGHWRLDAAEQTLFWSDQVFLIHGLPIGSAAPSLTEAIDAYHPDDRGLVAGKVADALQRAVAFEFVARIVRPDGAVRHVLSRGEVTRGAGDGVEGIFGVVQDMTAYVEAQEALEAARAAAETSAIDAKRQADTDELTGLTNRRRLLGSLEIAIADAHATTRDVSIAMFDMDLFKRINDTYGHTVGDEVLRRVARSVLSVLRDGDIVGRVGGEEFVLVLPGAGADRAVEIAERARLAIMAGTDAAMPEKVSASFGVALRLRGESSESLLRRADAALYEAKRAGRNVLKQAA